MLKQLKKIIHKVLFLFPQSLKSRYGKTTSQIGQDFWVFGEVFNGMQDGFFLDIGAADGISLSNTFLLEKRYHWQGLCIEANPHMFERLQFIRTSTCLNICLDAVEGDVDFLLRDDSSGIIDNDTDNSCDFGGEVIRIKTKTLATVLGEQNVPNEVDYLSIDIEGSEDRVFIDFPFDKYKFKCMTIERPKPRLRAVLEQNGYVLVKEIQGLDCFYVHKSFLHEYNSNVFKFWEKF